MLNNAIYNRRWLLNWQTSRNVKGVHKHCQGQETWIDRKTLERYLTETTNMVFHKEKMGCKLLLLTPEPLITGLLLWLRITMLP